MIVIFSFPSICFSESKTVVGEDCEIYLGDMKNKKDLEKFRKSVREQSLWNGVKKIDKRFSSGYSVIFFCLDDRYFEKIVVVSHTERKRKICDKIKITVDSEVMEAFFRQESLEKKEYWYDDINTVLTKKSDKINIGLIIETKIPDSDAYKKEMMENKEERQFHFMIQDNKDKYKVVDRRHLTKILEEQKLSSSGITDSDTVKLGKILNLDIIVLRMVYEESKVTKVLKVDTGEVLLFKTYKTEKEEGWIYYAETDDGDWYYDNRSMTHVSPNVIKVWKKLNFSKSGKEDEIQSRKKNKESIDGYDKLNHQIILSEVDCINNTQKKIKMVDYDDQGKVLEDYEYSDPDIRQIIPESIGDSLRREVCPR
jgi:hypothetical protein